MIKDFKLKEKESKGLDRETSMIVAHFYMALTSIKFLIFLGFLALISISANNPIWILLYMLIVLAFEFTMRVVYNKHFGKK